MRKALTNRSLAPILGNGISNAVKKNSPLCSGLPSRDNTVLAGTISTEETCDARDQSCDTLDKVAGRKHPWQYSAIVYADTKRKLSLTVNVRCATPFVPDFEVPKCVFGCLKKKKSLHLKTQRF